MARQSNITFKRNFQSLGQLHPPLCVQSNCQTHSVYLTFCLYLLVCLLSLSFKHLSLSVHLSLSLSVFYLSLFQVSLFICPSLSVFIGFYLSGVSLSGLSLSLFLTVPTSISVITCLSTLSISGVSMCKTLQSQSLCLLLFKCLFQSRFGLL